MMYLMRKLARNSTSDDYDAEQEDEKQEKRKLNRDNDKREGTCCGWCRLEEVGLNFSAARCQPARARSTRLPRIHPEQGPCVSGAESLASGTPHWTCWQTSHRRIHVCTSSNSMGRCASRWLLCRYIALRAASKLHAFPERIDLMRTINFAHRDCYFDGRCWCSDLPRNDHALDRLATLVLCMLAI